MASVSKSPLAKSKAPLVKSFTVARTDTTATLQVQLPWSARILYFVANGDIASDAATTAIVSVGTDVTANQYGTTDVKGSGAKATLFGTGGLGVVDNANATPNTGNKQIWAKYAETGTASTTGGPWVIDVFYVA